VGARRLKFSAIPAVNGVTQEVLSFYDGLNLPTQDEVML
jgi:hypothetical protein